MSLHCWLRGLSLSAIGLVAGCQSAVERVPDWPAALGGYAERMQLAEGRDTRAAHHRTGAAEVTFGSIEEPGAASQPASRPRSDDAAMPESARESDSQVYWRPNLARQMGRELKNFGRRDLWHGFKVAFADVENAAVLAVALSASIAVRETGVDDTIRSRTMNHRHLGDMDEPIQILGNPNLHFAGAGLLWLGSAIAKDERQHEVARSLGEALIVNGITTMGLKLATNTRAPDTDNRAWPSGHVSSAFTVAAVLNEHYGPLTGVPALALAGLVGYQRIDSRVHDLSDVVFGAALGYVVGASIAADQERDLPELWGMKIVPFTDPQTGATGLALYKSW